LNIARLIGNETGANYVAVDEMGSPNGGIGFDGGIFSGANARC
jgi:hypothetical protein